MLASTLEVERWALDVERCNLDYEYEHDYEEECGGRPLISVTKGH